MLHKEFFSMTLSNTLLATAFAAALATPGLAATVTDDATDVSLLWGDIIAASYAPVADTAAIDPVYAQIDGGLSFDPAFTLWLEDSAGDALLMGETGSYSFDGTDDLSFVFAVTGGSAAAQFGASVLANLHFDAPISDPFGAAADITTTATLTLGSATAPAPVPLPASLPLFAAALALGGAVLRRQN